jgi:hypothetical protein
MTRNLAIILLRTSDAVNVYKVVPRGDMETLPVVSFTVPISGSMEIEEAPLTSHESTAVSPGFIVLGSAVKDLIPSSVGVVIFSVTEGVTSGGFTCEGDPIVLHEASNKNIRDISRDKNSGEYRRPNSNNISNL